MALRTDYKCSSSGCYDYQSPEMHTKILQLQALINRFSPAKFGGFAPISVDGVIGKGTLTAYLLAMFTLSGAGGTVGPLAETLLLSTDTPEQLTQQIDGATTVLWQGVDALGATTEVAAASSSKPASVPATTTAASAAALAKINALHPGTQASILDVWTNLPPWGKAALVLAAAGGGIYAYKKYGKHAKPA
jgi:hypothetical protein